MNSRSLGLEVKLLTISSSHPFPTCPLSQGPSLGWWPHSPLQLMDLLCQEALLISGQVPATLQLDLFFPGKNRPQEGDWRQVGTEGSLGGGARGGGTGRSVICQKQPSSEGWTESPGWGGALPEPLIL